MNMQQIQGCSEEHRQMIEKALKRIDDKIDDSKICGLRGLERLAECIKEILEGLEEQHDENGGQWTIECSDCQEDPDTLAFTIKEENRIVICTRTFPLGQDRLNAVLFHELVHACCGTELDAEVLENHCFDGKGASFPTSDDAPKFDRLPHAGSLRVGTYVVWDTNNGKTYIKKQQVGEEDSLGPVEKGKRLKPVFKPCKVTVALLTATINEDNEASDDEYHFSVFVEGTQTRHPALGNYIVPSGSTLPHVIQINLIVFVGYMAFKGEMATVNIRVTAFEDDPTSDDVAESGLVTVQARCPDLINVDVQAASDAVDTTLSFQVFFE